ncbi:MAG: alpha/beta fold hydrolase [Parasphingopyxis sp.]|nr:alpha/beta hydrolase [Sphingomonadales bacterium]
MDFDNLDRRAHPQGLTIDRWHAPDGWDHRRWRWPAEPTKSARGSMIFQAGRGDFFEKYLESLAQWHADGWNLCGFDWRGQSGSGRFLANPKVGHVEGFEAWTADLQAFAEPWLAEMPGPHVLAGHSMGGHLIMRYLIEQQPPIDAVVLSAPMLKVVSKPFSEKLAAFIARFLAGIGLAKVKAWPGNERPSVPGSSRQKLLTHDFDRYADEDWWTANHPELKLGPPSWRWLVSAYASSAAMFAEGVLEKIDVPVLMVATAQDRLVSADAIREAAERLPDVRLYMHEIAAHELLRERDDIRDEVMREIVDFLEARAPARR